MLLVQQLHLVMMSKYSKFGVDIFNTSLVMAYIKVFAPRRLSSDHSKNELQQFCTEPMLCQNQHLSCVSLIFESGVWFLCMTQHLIYQTLLNFYSIQLNNYIMCNIMTTFACSILAAFKQIFVNQNPSGFYYGYITSNTSLD